MKLRIGSRGSRLALWQANHVSQMLQHMGHEAEITVIKTTGDKIQEVSLANVGTKGMFTKEIEEALAAGSIDLAVHSLKDLPTELMPEFCIAAILKREDPRDAFLSVQHASLINVPSGGHIGTSSLRRQAQLRAMRPDLRLSPLRGNVDTRIRKLEAGEYDAIILASAGVNRLGMEQYVRVHFDPKDMLPAAGQGALAIETMASNSKLRPILALLNDPKTEAEVRCERALLSALGGGCQVPIAALAQNAGAELRLDALVARPDGSEVIREVQEGGHPESLGESVARVLLRKGAKRILQDVHHSTAAVPSQP